jgi:hypothetical protein
MVVRCEVTQSQGSRVRISFVVRMCACISSVFVLLCVRAGSEMDPYPIQGLVPRI